MNSHPNATVSVFAGACTILVVYGASLFGLDEPPAEVGAAFTTIVTAAILFIGKRGS